MLMMRPPTAPFSRIIGRAAERIATNALLRFVLMTVSKSSSSIRRIRPSFVMPALFTSTSSRPCASMMRSSVSESDLETAMSHVATSALPPSALISSTTCWSLSAERATATTCSPSFASRLAMAAPMPREAPVTKATRFSVMMTTPSRSLPRPSSLRSRQRVRARQRIHGQPAIDLLQQSGEHATRRELDEPRVRGRRDLLHRLFPADGLHDLIDEQPLDGHDVGVRLGGDVGVHDAWIPRRVMKLDLLKL